MPVQRGSFGLNEDASAAPWPDVNSGPVAGNEHITLGSLPEDTRELVASCDSFLLPLDARIPGRLRAQIWAGEFIDLPRIFSLSGGGPRSSHFARATAKVGGSQLSLEQWMKAFHLYKSVFIMQPANLPSARKMLKYMQVIQNLYGQGVIGEHLALTQDSEYALSILGVVTSPKPGVSSVSDVYVGLCVRVCIMPLPLASTITTGPLAFWSKSRRKSGDTTEDHDHQMTSPLAPVTGTDPLT